MPDSSQDFPDTDERLSRKIRQRRCIATREVVAMEELVRFALAPDGSLTLDLSGKLPGRGAHLTPTHAALEQAIKSKAFSRAFKQPVAIPEDFAVHMGRQIEANLLSRLSMARRSGDAVVGQDAVFAAAQNGSLCLLIIPGDAGANASGRLAGIKRDFPNLIFSTAETLGHALGKPRVTNLALTHPHKSEQFLALAHKFRDFFPSTGHEPHL